MPSVATAMLVDMVGEAGGRKLAVLVGGAVLRANLKKFCQSGLKTTAVLRLL